MQVVFFIAIFLLLVYVVLIIYYRQSWVSISDFKFDILNFKPATKISIIIPARNEEQNIANCLQSIINQSYPPELFEVLVVDDHSTDNTAAIVLSYQQQNIKLITLKDVITANAINAYKKKAIEIAIGQSTGELMLTTDADCIAPANWLQTIAAFYQEKKPSFIVMPVAIKYSNKFIEMFQAVDFITLQGITAASVNKKIHSMCNGANLAYTKKAFNDVNGFTGIDSIPSGDDMLLMHKIYKQNPDGILFLKSKKVIVQTQPVKTVKEFFNQRIRWASKADKYDDKRIFAVLLLVYFFNVVCLLCFLLSYCTNWIFLLPIAAKILIELLFLYPVAQFFNAKKLLWWFVIMQPFHIIYTVIAGWLGKFGSYQWKDRNVK